MEQKQNKQENQKKELTPQQLQKRKKLIIFPLFFLAFAGCIWLIFAPSSDGEVNRDEISGFNADIPLPSEDGIIADKKTAYEQEQMRSKQEEQRRSLQDFSFTLGEQEQSQEEYERQVRLAPVPPDYQDDLNNGRITRNTSLQSSAYAYQDINRQLGSFYETPKADPEKEELLKKVEELTAQLEEQQQSRFSTDEQLALLERSYELAAKYMNPDAQPKEVIPTGQVTSSGNGKTQVLPVQALQDQTVSGLQGYITNEELIEQFSQPRNFGFNTAVGTSSTIGKNTISACIHEEQTVMDGQPVRIRLLEPIRAGYITVPKNAILTGIARVQGERLDVNISSLEYAGNIIPVELTVYDSDGQKGISVPSSLEMQAVNEAMANIGSGLGSSITFTQSAGQQIAMDLTRGVLQGGSQYLSKKFRTVKVNLKANYQIMLYAKQ